MSDSMKATILENGIESQLAGMLNRANLVRGWLNRVAYPRLVKMQRMRWMTEGASEGESWEPLKEKTKLSKLKRFADYPGAGQKMLIATGKLIAGITGDNPADHYKLVTDTRIEMGTSVSYAKFVNEARNIVDISEETASELTEDLKQYLVSG